MLSLSWKTAYDALMNRWTKLLYRMAGYCQMIALDPNKAPPAIPEMPLAALLEMYFEQERRSAKRLDELARLLAAKGTLPEAKDWDSLLLYMRIECAWDFLAQILVEDTRGRILVPDPDSDSSDAELIEWLLIPVWRRRGDHWVKLVAQSRALHRPFYGLDPA